MRHKATQLIIWSVLMLLPAGAAAQTDSLLIDSTTVTAVRPTAAVVPGAQITRIDLRQVQSLPSILGSADPLAYAHYLPSMSAQSELDAGIHIQGNDSQHNMVSSGGVPIFGASHLLGLFSVFNPSHYERMDYRTSAPTLNRLGGSIDMALPKILEESGKIVRGSFRAGLLAAEGSLTVPLGSKAGVKASARRTYMNLLYGDFLTFDGVGIKYGFTDLNLTARYRPTRDDDIYADLYWGRDDLSGGAGAFSADVDCWWSNTLAAVHWKHKNLKQKLYYSSYTLNANALWSDIHASLPSRIQTSGYRADLSLGAFAAGLESALYNVQPQSPDMGGNSLSYDSMKEPAQKGWENTVYGRYKQLWGPFSLEAGLKGSLFLNPEGKWNAGLDPDLVLGWNFYHLGRLSLRAGTQHQYIVRTGLSDSGLPLEFWILSGKYSMPQTSAGAGLSYMLDLGEYTFGADAYLRTMKNQVEYQGSMMDFATGMYSLERALLSGRGRAYGINLSLNKVAGNLTGWIAYAWGRSLRTFQGMEECPASHERIHELDAVLTYKLGRWDFGATLVAASGTPFTRPEYLFLMGQRVATWWGPHNGSRLAPYFRADLSANYFFHREPRREDGICLSVYNVTGADNQLYWHLNLDREAESFKYCPVSAGIKFMPSLTYFYKF